MTNRAQSRFLSVGWKLAGSTVVVVAVLAVGAHVVVSRNERETMMRSKQAAADMLIRLAAAGLSAPLSFADDRGVEEQVALLAANEEVVYGAAWSISMDSPDRVGERLGELKRGSLVVPEPDSIPRTIQREVNDFLIARAPVVDPSGTTVGVVAIGFSLEKERAAMVASERRTLVFSLAAAVVLAALLLLIARRSIITPLRVLMDAAKVLERGAKASIQATSNDEIGSLARALQTMSEAIRDREASLSARNRDMRLILDNAVEGFLTVLADGTLSDERSRMMDLWFAAPPPRARFVDYFAGIAGADGEWMRLSWESLETGLCRWKSRSPSFLTSSRAADATSSWSIVPSPARPTFYRRCWSSYATPPPKWNGSAPTNHRRKRSPSSRASRAIGSVSPRSWRSVAS